MNNMPTLLLLLATYAISMFKNSNLDYGDHVMVGLVKRFMEQYFRWPCNQHTNDLEGVGQMKWSLSLLY